MRNNPLERKLERAEESVKICKSNIKRQEKELMECNKKMTIMQSKIESINSVPSNVLEKLLCINDKLMISVEVHKGIISELQGDLNKNEDNLHQLKSISI